MKRILYILTIVLILSSCSSEQEDKIIFYDEHLQENVVRELNEKGVTYKVLDGNSIVYSRADSEVVEIIYNDSIANQPVRYSFFDKEEGLKFILFLEKNNIMYKKKEETNKFNVWIERGDQAIASEHLKSMGSE